MTSKLSISLTQDDLDWLDSIVARGDAGTRSGAVHVALRHHRESVIERALVAQFDQAMHEHADETEAWDGTAGDGL